MVDPENGQKSSTDAARGERIKRLLARLGIFQKQLANKLDVGVPTVNRWVKGHNRPQEAHIHSLAQIANVPVPAMIAYIDAGEPLPAPKEQKPEEKASETRESRVGSQSAATGDESKADSSGLTGSAGRSARDDIMELERKLESMTLSVGRYAFEADELERLLTAEREKSNRYWTKLKWAGIDPEAPDPPEQSDPPKPKAERKE